MMPWGGTPESALADRGYVVIRDPSPGGIMPRTLCRKISGVFSGGAQLSRCRSTATGPYPMTEGTKI